MTKSVDEQSAEIIYHIDRMEREITVLRAERDHARAIQERIAKLLRGIHALLYPPPVTTADGRTWVFRPKDPDPHVILQELSDRIRALPDELFAIEQPCEHKNTKSVREIDGTLFRCLDCGAPVDVGSKP